MKLDECPHDLPWSISLHRPELCMCANLVAEYTHLCSCIESCQSYWYTFANTPDQLCTDTRQYPCSWNEIKSNDSNTHTKGKSPSIRLLVFIFMQNETSSASTSIFASMGAHTKLFALWVWATLLGLSKFNTLNDHFRIHGRPWAVSLEFGLPSGNLSRLHPHPANNRIGRRTHASDSHRCVHLSCFYTPDTWIAPHRRWPGNSFRRPLVCNRQCHHTAMFSVCQQEAFNEVDIFWRIEIAPDSYLTKMHRPSLHWNSSSAQARFTGFSSSNLQLFSSSPESQSAYVMQLINQSYYIHWNINLQTKCNEPTTFDCSVTLFHIAFPFNWYTRAVATLEFIAGAAGRFHAQATHFIASICQCYAIILFLYIWYVKIESFDNKSKKNAHSFLSLDKYIPLQSFSPVGQQEKREWKERRVLDEFRAHCVQHSICKCISFTITAKSRQNTATS